MKIFIKKLIMALGIVVSCAPSQTSATWWDDFIAQPIAKLYQKTAVWAKKNPTAAKVAAVGAGVTTVSVLAYAGYRYWYSQQPSAPQPPTSEPSTPTTPLRLKPFDYNSPQNTTFSAASHQADSSNTNDHPLKSLLANYSNNPIDTSHYNKQNFINLMLSLNPNYNSGNTNSAEIVVSPATENNNNDTVDITSHLEEQIQVESTSTDNQAVQVEAQQELQQTTPYNIYQTPVYHVPEPKYYNYFHKLIPQELQNSNALTSFTHNCWQGKQKLFNAIMIQDTWLTDENRCVIPACAFMIEWAQTYGYRLSKRREGHELNEDLFKATLRGKLGQITPYKSIYHLQAEFKADDATKLLEMLYTLIKVLPAGNCHYIQVRLHSESLKIFLGCAPQCKQILTQLGYNFKIELHNEPAAQAHEPAQAAVTISAQDAVPLYKETIAKHLQCHSDIYKASEYTFDPACILRGGALLHQITTDDTLPPYNSNQHIKNLQEQLQISYREAYQQCFVDICWFAYYHHLATGTIDTGFEEGSFVFEDKTGNLEQFLYGYLDYIATLKDPHTQQNYSKGATSDWRAANPFVHYRASTHIGENSMGVNIVNDQAATQMMLPVDKRHILVSVIRLPNQSNRILFKPENYGIATPADIVHHASEAVAAQARKIPTLRWLLSLPSDDNDTMQKERVPEWKQDFIKAFMLQFIRVLPEETLINLKKNLKLNLVVIKNILNQIDIQDNPELASALSRLQKQLDDKDNRIGNESALNHDDMVIFGKYCNFINCKEYDAAVTYKPVVEAYAQLKKAYACDKAAKQVEASQTTVDYASSLIQAWYQYQALTQTTCFYNDYLTTLHWFIDSLQTSINSDNPSVSLMIADLYNQKAQIEALKLARIQQQSAEAIEQHIALAQESAKSFEVCNNNTPSPYQQLDWTDNEKKTLPNEIQQQQCIGTLLGLDGFRAIIYSGTNYQQLKTHASFVANIIQKQYQDFLQSNNHRAAEQLVELLWQCHKATCKNINTIIDRQEFFSQNNDAYQQILAALTEKANARFKQWKGSFDNNTQPKLLLKLLKNAIRIQILHEFKMRIICGTSRDNLQKMAKNLASETEELLEKWFPAPDAEGSAFTHASPIAKRLHALYMQNNAHNSGLGNSFAVINKHNITNEQ